MINYKDLIIIILIGVCLSIFIHLIKCSNCTTENFNIDYEHARDIKGLQQDFMKKYLNNVKKLLSTNNKIDDMKHRMKRIYEKLQDKYESETQRKILINTNGEITFLD